MAVVQAGMALGRMALFFGVGAVAGPAVLRSRKFSEFLAELQEKGADQGQGSGTDPIAATLADLTRQVREISSTSVTVVQVDSDNGSVTALVVPAAAVGAVSYCYLWWKGISLSSLMYVTKRNMANAIASMTKHLEQVQSSLAAAKKHLTQRIQHVDDKLDQQKEISGQIKDQVTGARIKIQSIGSDMDSIKNMVMGLDEKMDSIEAKQNYSCAAVGYLCRFIEEEGQKLPEPLEGFQRRVKHIAGSSSLELPGLGFGQLLAIELDDPSAGRMLRSRAIDSARLILP